MQILWWSETCWTGAAWTLCSVTWLAGFFHVHNVGDQISEKSQYYMSPVSTVCADSGSARRASDSKGQFGLRAGGAWHFVYFRLSSQKMSHLHCVDGRVCVWERLSVMGFGVLMRLFYKEFLFSYSCSAVFPALLLTLEDSGRVMEPLCSWIRFCFCLIVPLSQPVCCCLNACLLLPYFVVFWLFIFQQ